MSVDFFGASVWQAVEPALSGLVLLLLGVLLTGVLRRSGHRRAPRPILERNTLPTLWFEALKRHLSVFFSPLPPRAPPGHRFGLLQPVPISIHQYRGRLNRKNEFF